MAYTLLFFFLQNAVCFIIITYLVPVLFTFYIQGMLKLKKNNSGAKRLKYEHRLRLFEYRVLRKIFGHKGGELTGKRRRFLKTSL